MGRAAGFPNSVYKGCTLSQSSVVLAGSHRFSSALVQHTPDSGVTPLLSREIKD